MTAPAGTLAIAFHPVGFVGELFDEALEEAQAGPIEARTAAGAPGRRGGDDVRLLAAGRARVLVDRPVPLGHQSRASAVVGLVGADGIGIALDSALNLFQWHRVAVILLAIFAVVILAEVVVAQVRRRIL